MTHPVSPLAPQKALALRAIEGARVATLATGLRYQNRDDLLLVELAPGTSAAGVLTQSLTAAAPVQWCKQQLRHGRARALLVNAGNANAATGRVGEAIVHATADAVAAQLGCKPGDVLLASTGIIGRPLTKKAFVPFIAPIADALSPDAKGWPKAARAIMTTDTFAKGLSRTATIQGTRVTLTGFAKGSGMIAPNMATLLGFVFTDAKLPPALLRGLLKEAVAVSFNAITVDGDTSTNDTLLAFATGQVAHGAIKGLQDPAFRDFRTVFTELLTELAILVVRDGEGAQKLITLDVSGAKNDAHAHQIAMTVANSPLVKTAIAGEDANWGRILGAAGRAGVPINADKARVAMGGHLICRHGQQLKKYDERPVTKHLKGRDIRIELDVGVGKGKARVYTCDLTHGYIDINGSYRS